MVVSFLTKYWMDIVLIIVLIAVLMFLYKQGKVSTVKKIILALVIQAEKALGSGTGELKYAMVIEAIYSKLPFTIRMLFTRRDLDIYIEEAVDKLKEILSKDITLTGYDDEKYILNILEDKK